MTSSKRGYEYENQLVKGVYQHSASNLLPVPCGFSGNHAVPSPDFLVDDGEKVHAFEIKRTSNNAQTFTYEADGDGITDETSGDIDQLRTFARAYPRTVCTYLGVRFNNRQLILGKLWHKTADTDQLLDSVITTTPTEAVITRSNNISFRKPNSDISDSEWTSASNGDDIQCIVDTIGTE